MSLNLEWRARLGRWREIMPTLLYQAQQPISVEAHFSKAHLDPVKAAKGPFRKLKPGQTWGEFWEYGWFRAQVRTPSSCAGKRLVLKGLFGGDALVFVNGKAAGTLDRQHGEITLSQKAVTGQSFSILAEVYAGHGPTPVGSGPVPHGQPAIPKPEGKLATVGKSSIGIWEEELYQAWMDFDTLFRLREELPKEELRVAEIDEALKNFTLAVDLELPMPELRKAALKGRAILRPQLAKRNGSTSALLTCFGHSHIDVAWLWPLAETQRKNGRTFSTQMALMEEYPEFKFLQSQPHLYRMVKQDYPEIYSRIKAKAKKGQWIPEGGMWVEADTNVSGGEALIRQFVHGKKFFKKEFGVESELMWLPDVFGYSGNMPQIMKGCGIKYFSTAKIFWNYYGGDNFPLNSFWWEGIDGSKVFAHMHNDYNSYTDPAHLIRRWKERVQTDKLDGRLVPFGWGDGGGGVTRDHLEFLKRMKNLEGVPRTVQAPPKAFFDREWKRRNDWPSYVGELYFQCHRGTYTSQAATKKGNRKSEFALREAEIWGSAALAMKSAAFPYAAMDEAWKGVLLNQFHDILPGSSIHRVYVEAEALYAQVLDTAGRTSQKAASSLLKAQGGSLTVFNSLAFKRDALLEVPSGTGALQDSGGRVLQAQKHGAKTYVEVKDLPSLGWSTLHRTSAKPLAQAQTELSAKGRVLENRYLKITLNALGEIEQCLDKEKGRDWAAAPLNSLRLYKDVPSVYDAWDLDAHYKLAPLPLKAPAKIEAAAKGPLFAALKVTRKIGSSIFKQEIRLGAGSRRVDFITEVDWREQHRLLKANFPVAVSSEQALHEIQFGYLGRPTHASRQFDADRYEVCAHKWSALTETTRGAALINDCKYGVSVEGNSINLSLLRSPLHPDPAADKRINHFNYAFYAWDGWDAMPELQKEAYAFNVETLALKGAGGTKSLLKLDEPGIMLEALKPAEDGSGDLIARLYESSRKASKVRLDFGLTLKSAFEADMLERPGKKLSLKSGSQGPSLALDFHPFEIKTLRLKL
jgi:alpha-mannosidase